MHGRALVVDPKAQRLAALTSDLVHTEMAIADIMEDDDKLSRQCIQPRCPPTIPASLNMPTLSAPRMGCSLASARMVRLSWGSCSWFSLM